MPLLMAPQFRSLHSSPFELLISSQHDPIVSSDDTDVESEEMLLQFPHLNATLTPTFTRIDFLLYRVFGILATT